MHPRESTRPRTLSPRRRPFGPSSKGEGGGEGRLDGGAMVDPRPRPLHPSLDHAEGGRPLPNGPTTPSYRAPLLSCASSLFRSPLFSPYSYLFASIFTSTFTSLFLSLPLSASLILSRPLSASLYLSLPLSLSSSISLSLYSTFPTRNRSALAVSCKSLWTWSPIVSNPIEDQSNCLRARSWAAKNPRGSRNILTTILEKDGHISARVGVVRHHQQTVRPSSKHLSGYLDHITFGVAPLLSPIFCVQGVVSIWLDSDAGEPTSTSRISSSLGRLDRLGRIRCQTVNRRPRAMLRR